MWTSISRVLHPRLVYRRQETDMSILQGESRSQKNVLQSMGETTCSVWSTLGLVTVPSCLATNNRCHCSDNSLFPWFGIVGITALIPVVQGKMQLTVHY